MAYAAGTRPSCMSAAKKKGRSSVAGIRRSSLMGARNWPAGAIRSHATTKLPAVDDSHDDQVIAIAGTANVASSLVLDDADPRRRVQVAAVAREFAPHQSDDSTIDFNSVHRPRPMDERVLDVDPSPRPDDQNGRIGKELVRRGDDRLPDDAHVPAAVQDLRRCSEVEVHEMSIRTWLCVRRIHEVPVLLPDRLTFVLNDVNARI